ncbi:hypothetical protein ACFX13_039233 [Malus domestica]
MDRDPKPRSLNLQVSLVLQLFSSVVSKMASKTKLLLTDLMSGVNHVPSNYIRPFCDRPNLTDVQTSDASSITLIDLKNLHGP